MAALPAGAQQEPALERAVDFRADVHPLLQTRCFRCHSGANPKAGVRLDRRPEILGETTGRPLAVPGKSAESRLIHLVAGLVEGEVMPQKGERLSAREVALLRAWIDQGLPWDESLLPSTLLSDHWAFQPIRRPAVPGMTWGRNPVDAFVGEGHRKRGLAPAPEASKRTLIRRLSLDLTGLPPTPEEVAAFVEDASPDAYEKLVERLLASPHYGERWGRHWLDVARYAESEGYESNHPRPYAWRYRDYVVSSFNSDKPFDRFIREQVAGDELEPASDENLVATGFLAAARLSSNEEDKALQRNDVLVDIVNAAGASFLGLTIACAQCHNHKWDPVSQRDYYRLQAFFVKGMPNNLALGDPALWAEFNAKKPLEYEALVQLRQALYEKGRQRFIERAKSKMAPEMLAALALPDEKRTPAQRELFRQADLAFQATPGGYEAAIPQEDKALYNEARKRVDDLKKKMGVEEPQTWGFYSPATSPHAVAVLPSIGFYPLPYEPAELRRATGYLRIRGEVHRRGPAVPPGWPEVLGATPPGAAGERPRTALADWLAGRGNPLTARVWANRVWHYHFGRGLVATPGDFGMRGAAPSHPELLDWLACELIEGGPSTGAPAEPSLGASASTPLGAGWSTKRLHRLIVTSAAYRQAARPHAGNASIDPDNAFLWRWEPRRLEAESIRDSALAASGELDRRPGGAYVAADQADRTLRRSLYLMQRRDGVMAMQSLFDAPTMNESCSGRHVSTVALQPLYLLNSAFMVDRARALAARVRARAGPDRRAQAEAAFELALARPPDEPERRAATDYLESADVEPSDGVSARLVQFCQVVLNLNEFVYID